MSASAATALTSSFGSCTEVTAATSGAETASFRRSVQQACLTHRGKAMPLPRLPFQQSAACDCIAADMLAAAMQTRFVTLTS